MANTASARKRIRQTETRTLRNAARKSRMRTFVKKLPGRHQFVNAGAAIAALRDAQPELQRAATKGVVHKNTVARKIARLSARVKSISAKA